MPISAAQLGYLQLAAEMPSHGEQLAAVATAVDRYLSEAVEDLDSLTRLTIG